LLNPKATKSMNLKVYKMFCAISVKTVGMLIA
jgi:hypothetical protein